MNMYYVVNARLPNKKAYGIQIAKMCEAFIEAGVDLTLVIPRTRAARTSSMKDFYHLRVDVPTFILPNLDWYASGKMLFFLSSIIFMTMSLLYLWWKQLRGGKAVVYTVDMDTFSFTFLPLSGYPVIAELHDSKPPNLLTRFFFRSDARVIATNSEIKADLQNAFDISSEQFGVEPNGVDLSQFARIPAQTDTRSAHQLPEGPLALYAGRFYPWKGLRIIAEAARRAPEISFAVLGGSREEFVRTTGVQDIPANLHVMGECAASEVPRKLAAADALLILGTAQNERSYRHTSPMKVFEYMAVGRPVVASATPALKSIIPADCAYFYQPDDATSLVTAVRSATSSSEGQDAMLARASMLAEHHSWDRRARRIMQFIGE